MARLNTRPSVSSSRWQSATPQRDNTSDQENRDPKATAQPDKQRPMERSKLPTPGSDNSNASRGQKRKRAGPEAHATQGADKEHSAKFNKYFDPNQDPQLRREVKRKSRALERNFQENRDDWLHKNGGDGLVETIHEADRIYRNVKQTNDATVDSRLLVNLSDLAYKKTAHLVLGDASTGVDVDEFLSKCITYMRNGGPVNDGNEPGPTGSRRRRARERADSDDEGEDSMHGELLDWESLGRHACFPHNARPAVPSFLLGPLSVQKKQRTQTQRQPRQAKDAPGREARPEALTKDDLQQSDENGLTAICTRIKRHLEQHVEQAQHTLERAGFGEEDLGTEPLKAAMRKCRVTNTGGPSLFDYVVNPRSFGQTIENMFYVSFLIKEGAIGIQPDEDHMPTLVSAEATTLDDKRKKEISRHQAVFALDYATWQQLVQAFDIREPMIPHRDDGPAAQLGGRGWYN